MMISVWKFNAVLKSRVIKEKAMNRTIGVRPMTSTIESPILGRAIGVPRAVMGSASVYGATSTMLRFCKIYQNYS